jgi:hypothetical protein
VGAAELVEPQELFHPFKHEFHLPPCPIEAEHVGCGPVARR